VSPKTVQALFATKAALLAAAVDYPIAGDVADVPIIARESVRSVESAPDAATMLDRHAGHVVAINIRSAGLARVVESAAGSSQLVTGLWEQMTANRRFGARWAATTLLTKPGTRPGLTPKQAERDFVIAIDWGTYRTLTGELGLTPGQVRAWMHSYYQRMFLSQAPGHAARLRTFPASADPAPPQGAGQHDLPVHHQATTTPAADGVAASSDRAYVALYGSQIAPNYESRADRARHRKQSCAIRRRSWMVAPPRAQHGSSR
jgi:hypothetical protein